MRRQDVLEAGDHVIEDNQTAAQRAKAPELRDLIALESRPAARANDLILEVSVVLSEALALKWGHIDWEPGRIKIPVPKLEHLKGHELREIPLFPELRPYLEEAWDQAKPGSEWVITRYRQANANLRTQLERIIKKAGLSPWPRLFQNLRSTRETELLREHPIRVVCDWIGNSVSVAQKHYLQVTDTDYQLGSSKVTSQAKRQNGEAKSEAVEGEKSLQKAKQQPPEGIGNDPQETKKPLAKQGVMPIASSAFGPLHEDLAPPRGVEPLFSD